MPPVTRSAARAAADNDDDAPPAKKQKQRGGGGASGGAAAGAGAGVPRLRKAFHGGMRPVIGHRPPPGANPFAGPQRGGGNWTTLEW